MLGKQEEMSARPEERTPPKERRGFLFSRAFSAATAMLRVKDTMLCPVVTGNVHQS